MRKSSCDVGLYCPRGQVTAVEKVENVVVRTVLLEGGV
jgi:hypothetical protein